VHRIERAARQDRQANLRQSLEQTEAQLNEAFAALDVERGKRLRARWSKESSEADVPLDDPIWDRVSPALHWLAEHDRGAEAEKRAQLALQELEHGLQQGAAAEHLQQLHFEVRRNGQELPEPVERCFQERLAGAAQGAKRRERIILAATFSAGALLLVGFLAYLSIYRSWRGSAVERATHTIQTMLDANDIEGARAFIARLVRDDPQTSASSEVLDLQDKVEERRREQQRVEQFRTALSRLEQAPVDKDAELVANARSLIRSPSEQQALDDLLRRRREQTFFERLRELELKVRQIERDANYPPDNTEMALVDRVQLQLEELKNQTVKEGQRRQLADLTARLAEARKKLESKANPKR
jgi:hypothetical protein